MEPGGRSSGDYLSPNTSIFDYEDKYDLDDDYPGQNIYYKLYKRRWFMLFLFAFGAMNVTIVQMTFSALQDKAIVFYGYGFADKIAQL